MKNILLSLFVTITLTTAVSAQVKCPSDNAFFCTVYMLSSVGHAVAQHDLGAMYSSGQGIAQDKREAVRWYRKAAEQGEADAQSNLGWMYDNGEGVAQDYREAVRWYRKAAEQGVARAQYNLGLMYANGEGVITDYHEGYIWFSIAKANGNKSAADTLDNLDFSVFLTTSEIKSARLEAARRLEVIEQRKTDSAE